ncbi:hypothetical protein ACJX0J_024522, partial [Zea mays]
RFGVQLQFTTHLHFIHSFYGLDPIFYFDFLSVSVMVLEDTCVANLEMQSQQELYKAINSQLSQVPFFLLWFVDFWYFITQQFPKMMGQPCILCVGGMWKLKQVKNNYDNMRFGVAIKL